MFWTDGGSVGSSGLWGLEPSGGEIRELEIPPTYWEADGQEMEIDVLMRSEAHKLDEAPTYLVGKRQVIGNNVPERFEEKARHLEGLIDGSVIPNDEDPNDTDPEESLRRLEVAKKVFGDVKSPSNARARKLPTQPNKTHQRVASFDQEPSTPTFQNLALGHIKLLADEDEFEVESFFGGIQVQTSNCSFCRYACDFGIWNEKMILLEDASGVFCDGCNRSCEHVSDDPKCGDYPLTDTGYPFTPDSHQICGIPSSGLTLRTESARQQLKQIAKTYVRSVPGRHNMCSQIDEKDISPYQGLHFCRGNPWKQVDLAKVVICKGCKEEKLSIIKHQRHREFTRFDKVETVDPFGKVVYEAKQKRCMVCTGLATVKCKDCPLRFCDTCEICLRSLGESNVWNWKIYSNWCVGKGWLDNLLYYYNRSHLRNDTFILRGDGGGF
jgi:hypothetical protein